MDWSAWSSSFSHIVSFVGLHDFQVQRWHQGNEHFGRAWQAGDVVGCMVDLNEHTMMFTLNGEVLLDDSGSELAFKDFDVGEGWWFLQLYVIRLTNMYIMGIAMS